MHARHDAAFRSRAKIALVGYSMGGNLVLKLAGDLGAEAPRTTARSGWRLARHGPRPESADALHLPSPIGIYEKKVPARVAQAISPQSSALSPSL